MPDLNKKIKDALLRTRQWALGVDVEFPSSSCGQEKEKLPIIDFRGELLLDEFQRLQRDNPDKLFRNDNPHSKKDNWG